MEYGGDWLLEGAREADPKVGVLRLPWPVHYAPHHRHLEVLNSWVQWAPLWQTRLQVRLDLLRHLLEEGARRAPAPRTRGHLRREGAKAE